MTSSRIRRWIGLPMLALVSLALALSLVSQAAQGAKSKGLPAAFTGGVRPRPWDHRRARGDDQGSDRLLLQVRPDQRARRSQTPPAVAIAGSTASRLPRP